MYHLSSQMVCHHHHHHTSSKSSENINRSAQYEIALVTVKYENEPLLCYIMSQYGNTSNMLNTSAKNEDILRNIY